MKIAVISFTRPGSLLCRRLVQGFLAEGEDCIGFVREKDLEEGGQWPLIRARRDSAGLWTRKWFYQADGLIYIGAAGIAVRAIAPCLQDKLTDPAVVAVDEQGTFAVSLLSGHVGGANDLAQRTARILKAIPVVTTASDVRGLPAIDEWAVERGLVISDRTAACGVAAARLDGEPVGFFSDYPIEGTIPEGYEANRVCGENVWITGRLRRWEGEEGAFLRLIPQVLCVGVGCRKNTEASQIQNAVKRVLERENWDLRAVGRLASVDLKKNEPGLLETAAWLKVPFVTFCAGQLEQATGNLTESAFVRSVTGTGSVCERAALLGAGRRTADSLVIGKTIENGVTVAAAVLPLVIRQRRSHE